MSERNNQWMDEDGYSGRADFEKKINKEQMYGKMSEMETKERRLPSES